MRRWLASGLGLLLGGWIASVSAQDANWGLPDRSRPAVTLGMPRAKSEVPAPVSAPPADILPAAFTNDAPSPASALVPPPQDDFDAPPPFRPRELEPPLPRSSFSSSPESRSAPRSPYDPDRRRANYGQDGSPFGDTFRRHNGLFSSDHAFDSFISPLTNPFLFEDPRSLTEVRPIFIYQSIPTNNGAFRGGNVEFYGAQFRLAITDRLSFVVNKIGFTALNPGSGSNIPSGFGFSELHLGPKFTFIRNEDSRTLGAVGMIFQIPTGTPSTFQNTGKLSIVPYLSLAQNLFDTRLGSLNVMDTFGFTYSTNRQRTDYFYNSIHVDWDVLNQHHFYPLVELHWFYYSSSGNTRDFGTEGRDLINFGSMNTGGRNNLSLAAGFRYQFTERTSFGVAGELPINNRKDLQNFRLTIDFSWHY